MIQNETISPTVSEKMTLRDSIAGVLAKQNDFFKTNITKDIDFRIEQLKKLKQCIEKKEKVIFEALKTDLNKHKFEAYGTEVGMVYGEIDHFIRKLNGWAKPKKVGTSLFHFRSSSYIYPEPYGTVLIMGPWNFPFQLCLLPLIGALGAGNCAVVKPSEIATATSAIIKEIIDETFDPHYVAAFEGGIPVSQALLDNKFDYIFFTGSTYVGKIVYQAAAKHLTPVTLELGGKSPCIIDKNTDIEVSARRIVWGKLINAGQVCVAPDYLYVHEDIKEDLLNAIKKYIKKSYGKDPSKSKYYGRIINHKNFKRLSNLLNDGNIVFGGQSDEENRYISPTLIDNVSKEDAIMQEEIFGPVLPVLTYQNIEEVIRYIKANPKPLALYIFTKDKKISDKVLKETSSGGACINETVMHLGNSNLSFGGVGESGLGAYHGKTSFDTFSHHKSVMDKSFKPDLPVRYPPYRTGVKVLKSLMKRLG